MKGYLLSLLAGFLVGGVYAILRVKSPAPPIIALLGLLGMVVGEHLVGSILIHSDTQKVESTTSPPSDEP